MVLGNRGEALVQDVLERLVVSADHKGASPKVWAPVAHRLREPDQLSLICCKAAVSGRQSTAEEGDGAVVQVQDRPYSGPGRVALDYEGLVEVREREGGSRGERLLQLLEGDVGVSGPQEGVLLEESRQGGGDGAEVADEAPVVAR